MKRLKITSSLCLLSLYLFACSAEELSGPDYEDLDQAVYENALFPGSSKITLAVTNFGPKPAFSWSYESFNSPFSTIA